MAIKHKHYAVFFSPGTFLSETTEKEVEEWNPKEAILKGKNIVERYVARPYAFQFETRIVAEPIPDGEGGTLKVESKTIKSSGMFFITGTLESIDQIKARNNPKEKILIDNMGFNDWPIVIVNTNSYRTTLPFNKNDVIVDFAGCIIERGDSRKHIAYRKKKKAKGSKITVDSSGQKIKSKARKQ